MRLRCPYCGTRDLREFTFGGAALTRPAGNWGAAWDDYLHLRDNPAGESAEIWQHSGGCGAWLRVLRDTRTHEVARVALARVSPAEGGAA